MNLVITYFFSGCYTFCLNSRLYFIFKRRQPQKIASVERIYYAAAIICVHKKEQKQINKNGVCRKYRFIIHKLPSVQLYFRLCGQICTGSLKQFKNISDQQK